MFANLTAKFGLAAGKTTLALSKASPHILLGAGVILLGGGAYLIYKETKKYVKEEEIIEEMIAETKNSEDLTDEEKRNDERQLRISLFKIALKYYSLPVALMICGFACVIGGQVVLQNRYNYLAAAVVVLQKSYDKYRAVVAEKLGVDGEREAYRKASEKADGPGEKTLSDIDLDASYDRIYDERCREFKGDRNMDLFTLRSLQNEFTVLLRARGFVFLNEVYDALGIPWSQAGNVVGWYYKDVGEYVDFGVYDSNGELNPWAVIPDTDKPFRYNFRLSFNVDGVILPLLGQK